MTSLRCAEEFTASLPESIKKWLPRRVSRFCIDPNSEVRSYGQRADADLDEACEGFLAARCKSLRLHGVRSLVAVRYVDGEGKGAVVDLLALSFQSVENAFAYYTWELLGDVHPRAVELSPLDSGSVLDGTRALSFHGEHVVELSYFEPAVTDEQQTAHAAPLLRDFVRQVTARLPGEETLPESVRLLPDGERLRLGVSYHLRDVLGIDGAGPGAIGYYERGPQRYLVFIDDAGDEGAARDLERTLRAQPGYHRLKDMPFGAFELRLPQRGSDALWLMARYQDRIVGIGDDVYGLEHSTKKERDERALSRADRVRLLRRIMATR